MRTRPKRINRDEHMPTRFGSEVEFDLALVPGTVSPEAVRIRFQELQERLVKETLHETPNPVLRGRLHRAANEAAALAWATPFPLLVMPELFQEKARTVRLQLDRQKRILMRSKHWVGTASEPERPQ